MSTETQRSGWTTLPADQMTFLPPVQTHLLRSDLIKQTFKIQVAQPPRKRGEDTRFPVVYVTDANMCFDMFKAMSYMTHPRFILVGIGYPSDSPMAGERLRWREFSYPPYPAADPKALPLTNEATLIPEEGAKDFNGADDFRRFIGEQLIPFIDETYETIPGDNTYFGHSGGGFFGLFALFTEPALFKRYISSSPGLVYHGVTPGGFRHDNYDAGAVFVREFAESGRSFPGVQLFLSVGTEEEYGVPVGSGWQLTSGFFRMAAHLKTAAFPGLDVIARAFPGEDHMTVWPVAFMHGLRAVFGTA